MGRWQTIGVAALALAARADAATTGLAPSRAAACEAYLDERELRFRVPARTVTGRIDPASVREDAEPPPDFGQSLVFGHALLKPEGAAEAIPVSYAYWRTHDACGGWGPARGDRQTFELADDKAADGSLRVMRAAALAGAR